MTRETITLTDDMLRAHKLARIAATVTITNDDVGAAPPQLSVNDVSILEASSGTRTTPVLSLIPI